jgi:hypothetical protein
MAEFGDSHDDEGVGAESSSQEAVVPTDPGIQTRPQEAEIALEA